MTNTITLPRPIAAQALEAFDLHAKQYPHMIKGYTADAAEALRIALDQPQVEQAPVAWLCHNGSLARSKDDFMPSIRHLARPLYLHPDSPTTTSTHFSEWKPIETAPQGKIVLVHYKNRLGNGRTMRARYYPPDTLDSDTTESGWADEGWYEESEAYEYLMPLDGDPTHWMPLPKAPEQSPPSPLT